MRRRPSITLVILVASLWTASPWRDNRVTVDAAAAQANEPTVPLPNKDDSFKFAVLGGFGTGATTQYQLADQMAALHERFKYHTVILLGDNLHGRERPQDFRNKFELPYKRLLDQGVTFYASLGHEDSREQRYYKLFNMDGNLYYTFSPKADIHFFALESTYMHPEQVAWLEKELKGSSSDWKIAFFHHPLYSSGRRTGSDIRLRGVLEPLFLKHDVSVVFSGHDPFYERIKPQKDIAYFVVGSGGTFLPGDIDRNAGLSASGFDTDLAFMAAEIIGDQMYFNVISRSGQTVDSGMLTRRKTRTPQRLSPN
jgi:hypothetical protein